MQAGWNSLNKEQLAEDELAALEHVQQGLEQAQAMLRKGELDPDELAPAAVDSDVEVEEVEQDEVNQVEGVPGEGGEPGQEPGMNPR